MDITNDQDRYDIIFTSNLNSDDLMKNQNNGIGSESCVAGHAMATWFAIHLRCRKVIVITDTNVAITLEDELKSLISYIRKLGLEVHYKALKPGENSKTLKNAEKIWEQMAESEFGRTDLMIAFGGGVIGDLAGFCASVYMRGMAFIQIPTTLLAQIDSSIGGKVAVNLTQGKNLVGSFYNPELVIMHGKFLKTLPNSVLSDGIGELIKYGYLGNPELLNTLKYFGDINGFKNAIENDMVLFDDMIQLALRTKKVVVENDFKEMGIRKYLNFGHTIGHAIESGENFKISHGHCVANGCLWALRIAGKWDDYYFLRSLMDSYGIPVLLEIDVSRIMVYLRRDKKSENNGVNFILTNSVQGHIENQEKISMVDTRQLILAQYKENSNLSDEEFLLKIKNSARIQWFSFDELQKKLSVLAER